MKVLWFTNTPALGESYLSGKPIIGGGWIKSLDKEMQQKVDLHIAFEFIGNTLPFKYGNSHYYPIIKTKKTLFNKYITAKFSRIMLGKDVEKYLSIIKEVKPDIIHIHGTENSFGFIVGKTNIPVVISIQGIISVIKHKYLSGLEKKYLNTTKGYIYKLLGHKPFKTIYTSFEYMKKSEKNTLLQCRYFIGRTAWDKRVCSVLSPNSFYYHNDEILREGFYSNEWKNNRTNKLVVFTTSSNFFYKGFETVCHAISLLIEAGITNFEWQIAGISKDDLIVKAVKRKLKSLYPKTNLVLKGKLSELDLIDSLMNSNLYVMPSHIENSPNNLCEAMMLGMPCIATFAGGTGSLLKNGVSGVLIQDGDPWAMAGAIIEYTNNEEAFVEFGQKARIEALKRHDKNIISTNLVEIYQKITALNNIKQ